MLIDFVEEKFSENVTAISRTMFDKLTVNTSMAFILPLGLAMQTGQYLYITVLPLTTMSSMMFHSHHESKYGIWDRVMAVILMLLNTSLFFGGQVSLLEQIAVVGTILFAGVMYAAALIIDYDRYHAYWHGASTFVTAALLLFAAS